MREWIARLFRIPVVYAIVFWALVLFLGAVVLDKVVMPIVAGKWSSTEQVPDVLGKSSSEAEKILAAQGLGFQWAPEGRFSTKIPAGHVLLQRPAPGRLVKDGRTVQLTVSKGDHAVEVPDLRGKSQRQAEISLNRLGLAQGNIVPGAHESIPKGVVIRTEPPAGRQVHSGDKVDIVVSTGNAGGKVLLPDLSEKSLDQAFHVLDSLGLSSGTVKRNSSSGKLPNTVLEQSPRSGEYLAPGSKVDLTVAD